MRDLSEIRNEIDSVDAEIVALYEKRMRLAEQVAEYKIGTGKKVLDKEREKSKLDKIKTYATTEFTKCGVTELFEQIMAMSRKRQYQMLTEHGMIEKPGFDMVEKLPVAKAKIVFQGVEGAYTQVAMKRFFGENIDSMHVETWRDAMEAIRTGEADYAVLPMENSSAGIISENYDLLVEYGYSIVGEQIIQIDHCLLGIPEAELSDIRQVYSHPQALMQCSSFLEEHRTWENLASKNTAMAAKKIKEDGQKSEAAIANRLTADIYGLKILQENIQNNPNNSTRFIIVSKEKIYVKDAGKISIYFELPNESGSLYHALSHFIYNNINMNRIESRPIPKRNWEYRFFIDFDGNLKDSAVQNALRGLKEETATMSILGNY
ncbi:MAG: prephenate dehydratase [Roseburia sp.]|uniref:prephenate dehydratase n=1 Tax=Roseburia hominis TaxID=301301 RepID=UPI001F1BC60A|nr:prephenate dehydratase [Roseburia hominis]MDY4840335.1 prephenate dehydratase [Lachnospiraceae bacterium]